MQDELGYSASSLEPGWEHNEDLVSRELDHSDDEDDRHYGNDLDREDYLFEREW